MTRYLTIHVRAHEGRYHGDGDELPSPFRLFQALVAGAGISGPLDPPTKEALTWLEGLPDAPIIASPHLLRGQAVTMFMPNNDLDKFGGDVRNIAKTRGAQKVWRPRHFNAAVPWIYAWPFAEGGTHATTICALSEKLYQLGRGVDMAWAWGTVLDEPALDAQLFEYDGIVRRPSAGDGTQLACPSKGSFESLECRYRAPRFRHENGQRVFVQQPKVSYRQISYDSPPIQYIFELRSSTDSERRMAWPLEGASSLVIAAREAARARLSAAMPNRSYDVDRHLVGRKPDGSNAVPVERRVRIIAIPSIGMHHTDRAIRRLLVEIPAACPLRSEDVRWAFSGAVLVDPDTGEVKDVLLEPSINDDMLRLYGVGAGARVFRSVTPVALPEEDRRRRIEPTRKLAEAKSGLERVVEISRARASVVQALRHAGVRAPAESIRLQREPFEARGTHAEAFATGTRFSKHQMWHVEIAFDRPVRGPLLLGDGRFLGLGLMAPVQQTHGLWAFRVVSGLSSGADSEELARALRRAVMSRVQAEIGARGKLPLLVSGHAADGSPLRDKGHLAFQFDPQSQFLLVLAPHVFVHRSPYQNELEALRLLEQTLEGFCELRAGASGRLGLARASFAEVDHSLFAARQTWMSATPYLVTRHAKAGDATDAIIADVRAECERRGLPRPTSIGVSDIRGVRGKGLTGMVQLTFATAVSGPILLGKSRNMGGGMFETGPTAREPLPTGKP